MPNGGPLWTKKCEWEALIRDKRRAKPEQRMSVLSEEHRTRIKELLNEEAKTATEKDPGS